MKLAERIKKGLLLLDGAMGTELMTRGIEAGKCNEYLNIERPDVIFNIHSEYVNAGSDAIIANTFGANKYALRRHGLNDRADDINMAAVRTARRAAGERKYVLGDIGPSGEFLEPLGDVRPEELKNAFARQVKVLAEGGVDGFIIETMTAMDEMLIAIEAVKSVCELPVLASMSFGKGGGGYRTMMGVDVGTAAAKITALGVDAVGFNCGTLSLDEYVELAQRFVSAVKGLKSEAAILAEPNAGKPELLDDKVVYNVSVKEFAEAVEKMHSAGVNIIGGCCGTGPGHISAAAKRLKQR